MGGGVVGSGVGGGVEVGVGDVVGVGAGVCVGLKFYPHTLTPWHFFIFPDFTIFYGLLNVPSPQPVLCFAEGQTYCPAYNADLDRWIVDDLKKNMVEIVVLEERSRWFGTHNRLDDFPQLSSYITENFSKAEQIGIFNIYEKRGDKNWPLLGICSDPGK